MEPSEYQDRQKRGTCLSIMMAVAVAGFFALLLVVATGGWAVYVIGVALAIFLFGAFHYLLWGRSMLQQTAGAREEEVEYMAAVSAAAQFHLPNAKLRTLAAKCQVPSEWYETEEENPF